jgi:hypothetical protein
MLDQHEFKMLTRAVVSVEVPDELEFFDLEADGMIAELYATGALKTQPGSAEFGFADTAKVVLEFAVMLASAFQTFIKLAKEGKDAFKPPINLDNLRRDLELELLRNGLAGNRARKIAEAVTQEVASAQSQK